MKCYVIGCSDAATCAFDDFRVCEAHHTEDVLEILKRLEIMAVYWYGEDKIVLPCGPLKEEHFRCP